MSEQHCDHNCMHCHDFESNGCPVCGYKGLEVRFTTVDSLINPDLKEQLKQLKDKTFFLCTHRACNVAYYTDNAKIFTNQIKVPVWFKYEKDEYYICYCRKITLNDVIEAVNHLDGDISREQVLKYLGREKVEIDCLNNNPAGLSCDILFDNAIKYALNKK